jgi:hypothetical protein
MFVGTRQVITANGNGRLYLSVNDGHLRTTAASGSTSPVRR